jgi:hypothetical protein
MGIATRIRDANLSEARRADDPALRARLSDHFAEEVALLAETIGRDLSHWPTAVAGHAPPRPRSEQEVLPSARQV